MDYFKESLKLHKKNQGKIEVTSKIEADIHIIGINSDLFFTANENKATYEELKKYKNNITYQEIVSIHGHDAFLIEYKQLDNLLQDIF